MWRHLKTVITFCFSNTFMAHNLYLQWFCYSKHLHVNRNYRPNFTATSLSPKCCSANVPLDFCTNTDFEMKYFLTKALLAFWVIPNWFSRVCSQNGYINSKLMLRWDGHFNTRTGGGGGAKNAHPSGFSRIAENGGAQRRHFFSTCSQLTFDTLCKNFSPRSPKVRSPDQVKVKNGFLTLRLRSGHTRYPIGFKPSAFHKVITEGWLNIETTTIR